MPSLLWLIIAFLAGILVEWLLEIFFLRRRLFEQVAAERSQHEQALGEWSGKNTALQATLSSRDKELGALRVASNKLQADLASCAGARASLEQENGSLKARTNQLEAELNSIQETKIALGGDLKARGAEVIRLRADLDSQVTQNKNLAVDVARLAAGAATAAATIQTLEGDKKELTGQVADLRAQLSKANTDLDAAVSAQASANQQFAEWKAQLEQAHTDLNAAVNVKAALDGQVADLKGQLEEANAETNASIQARTKLEADLKAREAELAQVRADLDGHVAQTETLSADVVKFAAGAAAAAATIKALEGDTAGLSAQVADLQAQLSKARADLNAAFSAQSFADRHIADLRAQLDKANTDASAALQTRAKLESDLIVRDAELAHLHATLDSHRTQNKNLTADIASLTEGAGTATATIKALEGDRSELENQVGQLVVELSACKNARTMLEADLKARDVEIERLRMPPVPPPVSDGLAPATATPPPFSRKEYAALRDRSADDETPFETACPQHLSDVKGIGTVFETRLYEAGVGTFWELARLSDDDLKSILRMTKLQIGRTDFAALRADARRLAQETRSLGRKWMRCPPDDFEPMRGIGPTFEKRLYAAGICTFETLASVTVELLEEICHAPARLKPDYASWIEQAKVLAAQKAMRQEEA